MKLVGIQPSVLVRSVGNGKWPFSYFGPSWKEGQALNLPQLPLVSSHSMLQSVPVKKALFEMWKNVRKHGRKHVRKPFKTKRMASRNDQWTHMLLIKAPPWGIRLPAPVFKQLALFSPHFMLWCASELESTRCSPSRFFQVKWTQCAGGEWQMAFALLDSMPAPFLHGTNIFIFLRDDFCSSAIDLCASCYACPGEPGFAWQH